MKDHLPPDPDDPTNDSGDGSDPENTCSPPGRQTRLPSKRRELTKCERDIRRYEEASLKAGASLKRIQDEALFEARGFASFAAYVEATCTFDLPRARQLVRGAESAALLMSAGVEPLPTNEAQVRPLVPLDAPQQVEAWTKAVALNAQKPPSLRDVKAVVDAITGKAAGPTADLTRGWSREAVRRVGREPEAVRSAVVARVNADVSRAQALPESRRDDLDDAAAEGVTLELVELHVEAYRAEVAESGLDHEPTLAGVAAEAAAAVPSIPEGASLGTTTRSGRTLIIPGETNPLLVSLPRTLVPKPLLDGVPEASRSVIVEIGELERKGGPVKHGVLTVSEIRASAVLVGITAMMTRTNVSIDWARFTSNMLTGCLHACKNVFCYAGSIANRLFAQGFTPTLYPVRLDHFTNTAPPDITGIPREEACRERSVFSTSMGDLFGAWVPAWFIELVLEEVRLHPEWFAFFLTKNARRLKDFRFPSNAAVGVTITGEDKYLVGCDGRYQRNSPTPSEQLAYYNGLAADLGAVEGAAFIWLSLEPFRSEVYTLQPFFDAGVQMVAVGGQSRTAVCPAEQPDYRWVESVRSECRAAGAYLFEKENLLARPKEIPFPMSFLPDQEATDNDAAPQGEDR